MRRTENRLHGDIPYLIWNGIIPHYKHMKIWGVIFDIINGRVRGKNLYNIYNRDYFMGYASGTGFLLYWKPY